MAYKSAVPDLSIWPASTWSGFTTEQAALAMTAFRHDEQSRPDPVMHIAADHQQWQSSGPAFCLDSWLPWNSVELTTNGEIVPIRAGPHRLLSDDTSSSSNRETAELLYGTEYNEPDNDASLTLTRSPSQQQWRPILGRFEPTPTSSRSSASSASSACASPPAYASPPASDSLLTFAPTLWCPHSASSPWRPYSASSPCWPYAASSPPSQSLPPSPPLGSTPAAAAAAATTTTTTTALELPATTGGGTSDYNSVALKTGTIAADAVWTTFSPPKAASLMPSYTRCLSPSSKRGLAKRAVNTRHFCIFCKEDDQPRSVYRSHSMKNAHGEVVCPYVRRGTHWLAKSAWSDSLDGGDKADDADGDDDDDYDDDGNPVLLRTHFDRRARFLNKIVEDGWRRAQNAQTIYARG